MCIRVSGEGHNILHVAEALTVLGDLSGLKEARLKLFHIRAGRVPPGLDDKVLTAWNGLMLAAFAEAGRVLDRPDYTAAAVANAEFLHATMRRADGRLLRSWQAAAGDARYNAYLEDYAFPVSYTHLRAHETVLDLVFRLPLEKKNNYDS